MSDFVLHIKSAFFLSSTVLLNCGKPRFLKTQTPYSASSWFADQVLNSEENNMYYRDHRATQD